MSERGTYRIEGRPYDALRAFNELSKPAHGFRPSWSTEGSFLIRATPEQAQEIIKLLKGFASLRMRDVGAGARKYEAWARARLNEKQGNGSHESREEQKPLARHVVVLKRPEDDDLGFVQPARDIQISTLPATVSIGEPPDDAQPNTVRPLQVVSVAPFWREARRDMGTATQVPTRKRGARKSVPRPPDEEFRSSLRDRGVQGTADHYGVSTQTVRYLWAPGIEGAKALIPDGRSGRRCRKKTFTNNALV